MTHPIPNPMSLIPRPKPPIPGYCSNALIAVLLAPVCAVCDAILHEPLSGCVCGHCWGSIRPITPPVCDRCGDPLARPHQSLIPESPISNPESPIRNPQSVPGRALRASLRAVRQGRERRRSSAGSRGVRWRAERDHSRFEISAASVACATTCSVDANARSGGSRTGRLHCARPSALAPPIWTRVQSGSRDRSPSRSACGGRTGPATSNSSSGRAGRRPPEGQRCRRLRRAAPLVSRQAPSTKETGAD